MEAIEYLIFFQGGLFMVYDTKKGGYLQYSFDYFVTREVVGLVWRGVARYWGWRKIF